MKGHRHIIGGVKLVDQLDPFQIWADLGLLEVCDPKAVFLREEDVIQMEI
jgi:hypothetical protein